MCTLLCRLRIIAAHRDHFVRRLSLCPSVCLSVCLSRSHTFLVFTHCYVLEATHAFLGMLPLCLMIIIPPSKKEGHIVLHMSVGVSVSLNLVQLITQERFAPEASNLVGR